MPCRDYDSDGWGNNGPSDPTNTWQYKDLKERADMLARIACKAMDELETNSIAEAILLRDDEVREWYVAHKEADRKEAERVAAKKEKARLLRVAKAQEAQLRKNALAKLTDDEKRLLGIKL